VKTRATLIAAAMTVLGLNLETSGAVPQVTAVQPVRERINTPATTAISVYFSEAIDPSTVTATSFRVFGRWSGPAAGSFSFAPFAVTFTPAEPFFAGERVTVVLSKAIRNTSSEPLANGYAWCFSIRTAATTLDLNYVGRITTRLEGEIATAPYGAYAGDLDNDGWSDLLVPCEVPGDARVFINDGAGGYSSFTVESLPGGSAPSPSEGSDFDMDGEIDVAIGNGTNNQVTVLIGDGTGGFPARTSYTAGEFVRGVSVIDLNGDACDDIVTANRVDDNLSILMNNGDGTFAPAVAKETGGAGEYALAVGDANNDGLLDVFCGTYSSPSFIVVLVSDGAGNLTAGPLIPAGGRPWQLAAGDFNDDGNVDVASANSWQDNMGILYGDGAGGLSPVTTYPTGDFPHAIDAGDVDGDGDLDLISSNVGSADWTLYENQLGEFVNPRSLAASAAGSCAVLHDRDNDGDLDVTGVDEIDDWVYFFENGDSLTTPVTPRPPAPVTLFQNHPNPFNPGTTIRFDLTRAADVDLSIFDAGGRFVATVVRRRYAAGVYEVPWNGADARGAVQPSGVYFYRLTTGDFSEARKMVLLK
jgi:hypothetical protein